eukprot:COSAG05_NODE_147_length_16383_cov_266.102555_4_plen_63_part_00
MRLLISERMASSCCRSACRSVVQNKGGLQLGQTATLGRCKLPLEHYCERYDARRGEDEAMHM